MELIHKPVLLRECLEGLKIRPEGTYVDGTLGRAGHSREIAARLTTGRLICIDRDQAALDAAEDRLAGHLDKVTLIHGNFGDLAGLLDERGSPGLTACSLTWGCPPPSWTTRSGAFPTCTTPPWTCGWTGPRPSPPTRW